MLGEREVFQSLFGHILQTNFPPQNKSGMAKKGDWKMQKIYSTHSTPVDSKNKM